MTSHHQPEFDWLISRNQMTKAMRLQAAGAGIIGKIETKVPAARQHADVDDVTPALEAALDEATGGRCSALDGVTVHLKSLECVQSRRQDLLDPDALDESTTTIAGLVVVEHGSTRSEPMAFTMEYGAGAARLDDDAQRVARQWVDAATGQPSSEPATEPADAS